LRGLSLGGNRTAELANKSSEGERAMKQLTKFTLSTVLIRRIVVLLSLFGCLLGPILSVRSASNVIVVSSTIQAALDAANPGDTILVPPGTYHENLRVTKDNITIAGSKGAVIDAGDRIGIRVGIGSRTVVNGILTCPAFGLHNFTLKGLTIRNASFAGVFLIGVDGYHLTGTKYVDVHKQLLMALSSVKNQACQNSAASTFGRPFIACEIFVRKIETLILQV
jgi:hypothetical protein